MVKAWKKRYLLLLLAVIAAALLLLSPGTALANETTLHSWCCFDFATGNFVDYDASWDVYFQWVPGGQAGHPYASLCFLWHTDFVTLPGADYVNVGLSDVNGLTFAPMQGQPAPGLVYVMRTNAGRYFKMMTSVPVPWPPAEPEQDYAFTWDPLPSDPPAMLTDLTGFIAVPTSGTVDPVIGTALTAKVNGALAALGKGDEKTAANNLNALLNQIKAQRGKKISTAAADEITSQVEDVLAAIDLS
jgi:hypothetical protein